MDTCNPGPLLQIGGGALMIISTFLDWRFATSGLSTDAAGLFGIFTLVFGALLLVIGLAGSFVPQINLPSEVAGISIEKLAVMLAAAIFLWTFGSITADSVKIGIHLAWIGALVAEVGAMLRLRAAA